MEPDRLLSELEKSLDSQELLNQINTEQKEEQVSEKNIFSQKSLIILLISILMVEVGIVVYALQASQNIVIVSPEEKALLEQQQAEADIKEAKRLSLESKRTIKYPPLSLATWEEAETELLESIKLLEEIPKGTTVKKEANKLLQTYRQDYQNLREQLILEKTATSKLVAAQKLAIEASVIVQNPPHPTEVWQEAQGKWQEAISLLQEIPQDAFVAPEAVEKLDLYRINYQAVTTRLERQKESN
ncbi:MAG: hypothetical protein F6K40_00065 [Okeania sp. SIO3I5]|uniref:hypothetical protein n=1 Tax=Okeania sp. SIO3I5 TaxID=2607805 RepID=UPI0013BD34E7|nr:hypothetical protein [Okeania sp. SIO3I5]NEQ34788.1 hypothetical protein [Okeania sp. SIO3I5]